MTFKELFYVYETNSGAVEYYESYYSLILVVM